MRDRKLTLRFNPIEDARIVAFAEAEGLTRSEAVRRLIFWNRAPGFSLCLPPDHSQEHPIDK